MQHSAGWDTLTWSQEDGVLRAALCFTKNLHGPLEDAFADLDAEVLECAPPRRMEGEVGPGADCGSPVEFGDRGVGQSVHP